MVPPAPSRGPRAVLIVLGAVVLSITLCCGGCGLFGYLGLQRGKSDDRAAKAFARTALQESGKTWSLEAIHRYVSPTWGSSSDEKAIFGKIAKTLGPLKNLGEFTTQGFYYGSQNGLRAGTRVKMSAPATFAKADGMVYITVTKIDDKWGIEKLNLDSPIFHK